MALQMKFEIPDKLFREQIFSIKIELNASDTFAYACADSVIIEHDAIPLMVECYEKWGHDGVTAFMSAVREEKPIKPWITEKFIEASEWLSTQDIPLEYEED